VRNGTRIGGDAGESTGECKGESDSKDECEGRREQGVACAQAGVWVRRQGHGREGKDEAADESMGGGGGEGEKLQRERQQERW